MVASDGEVAPLTVHLNGGLRVWRTWHAPPYAAGNGPPQQDMNPRLAGRIFRVAVELGKIALRPGVNAAILVDAVIEVHARVVLMEHIADAIIAMSPLCLHCLGIRGPRLQVVRVGLVPSRGAIGNFGEFAPALFFAPAHPLGPRLQFLQRGELSCVRNIVRLWDHGYISCLSIREVNGSAYLNEPSIYKNR